MTNDEPTTWAQAYEDAEANAIGLARRALHVNSSSNRNRPNADRENIMGAAGELAFARAFGLRIDRTLRPNGDDGIDFCVPLKTRQRPLTIDIKTADRPYWLIVNQTDMRRHPADVYVFVDYNRGDPQLIGWEHCGIMQMMPTQDFGHGLINHFRLSRFLRPIGELANLLTTRTDGD